MRYSSLYRSLDMSSFDVRAFLRMLRCETHVVETGEVGHAEELVHALERDLQVTRYDGQSSKSSPSLALLYEDHMSTGFRNIKRESKTR